MTYKLIDLFSGAGGMTLGFEDERFCGGFKSILSIDNDQSAVDTHNRNFGGSSVCANIEDWLGENTVPNADVVIGGPPCQGFSLLNKKRKGDKRRALWEPFIEICDLSGAKVFVMENVAELYRSPELYDIIIKASQYGYIVDSCIVNSADYGVPQKRRRTIVLGRRGPISGFSFPPLPTHSDPKNNSNLPEWKTVRDAIGDLPQPSKKEIEGDAPLDLHIKRSPTEKSKLRYRAVPPGGNRFDLQKNAPEITPDCWIRKTSGGTDLFGRLWWDRPSVTIRTEFFKPEKGRYLHPVQHRPITHREAARIMGFPDDFKFCGSKIEIARQIGNAVPPMLAGNIAQLVTSMLIPMTKSA